MSYITARQRVRRMYQYFRKPEGSISEFARQTGIARSTYARHRNKFAALEILHPGKPLVLSKYFHPFKSKPAHNPRYEELIRLLPGLLAACPDQKNTPSKLFLEYQKLCPNGYSVNGFRRNYQLWRKSNNVCVFGHRKVVQITEEDKVILNQWRRGANLEEWRKAVVIQGSFEGIKLHDLRDKVEIGMVTLHKWISKFKEAGVQGLNRKIASLEPYRLGNEEKTRNVMKLLHEPPKLFGINRTSWRLEDLADIYFEEYGVKLGTTTIRLAIKRGGYCFRKAKVVLTSPDPNFRDKLNRVKNILSHLKTGEKFFSMDEFGPCSVKMKAGHSYVPANVIPEVPQLQKSKGSLICTAAIELSTNQVSHFYSLKKDSDEMIRLIDLLLDQYQGNQKLYISGDSASWHCSEKLKSHIETVNRTAETNQNITPFVEWVPLPSSAQFLNVIESIFSGLAKAVIHNSNYESVEACKSAIDGHFEKRNRYFQEHPKKAGKSIWGNELVKPVFDESQNCKEARYARV